MATISYTLREGKTNGTITAVFSYGKNNRQRVSTGIKIQSSNWNKKKGLPKNGVNTELIIKQLNLLSAFVLERYRKTETPFLADDFLKTCIKDFSNGLKADDMNKNKIFTDYILDYIKDAPNKNNKKNGVGLSESTVSQYEQLFRIITEYQTQKRIILKTERITFEEVERLKNWLLSKYRSGSVRTLIFIFKSVCRYAKKQGAILNIDISLIESPKSKKKLQEIQGQVLTFSDLDQIEKYTDLPERLIPVKNWLLLGCELGQRAGDLLNITEENIKETSEGKYIQVEQEKTGKTVIIPITERAGRLLKEGIPGPIEYKTFLRGIKKICRLAGINEEVVTKEKGGDTLTTAPKWQVLGTHTCRRSFSTNYYNKIPTSILKTVTGHATEDMLLRYIGKDATDTAQEVIKAFKMY